MKMQLSVAMAILIPVSGLAWEYVHWNPNGYGAWDSTTRWQDGHSPTESDRDNVMLANVDAWMEDGDFSFATTLTRIRLDGMRASLDLRFDSDQTGHFNTLQLVNPTSTTRARVYKSGSGTFFHDTKGNGCYFSEYFVTNGTLKLGFCEEQFTNMVYGACGPGVLLFDNASVRQVKGIVGDGTVSCSSSTQINLWGDVHHRWSDNSPFVFSGTVGENFAPTVRAGRHHFTGCSSSGNHAVRLYGGELGVATFGVRNGPSSMGSIGFYNFFGPARLLYLGSGESNSDPVSIQFLADCTEATLDGGAVGGLKVGHISAFSQEGFNLVLDGSNTTACVLGGTISETAAAQFRVTKKGSGIWRFSSLEQTSFNGPIAVEDGTIECTTLAPTNVACSVGGATNLGSYAAFALGAESTTGTLAYVGSTWARPFGRTIDIIGKGRLVGSSEDQGVISWFGVSAGADATLILDGTGLYDSVNDVSGGGLCIEKTGAGIWTVGGAIDVAKTDVRQGTLVVNATTNRYSWYRFTVKDLWGDDADEYFQCAQIALFDEDGNQQNLNLSECTDWGPCYVIDESYVQFDHQYGYSHANRSLSKVFKGTTGLMSVRREPAQETALSDPGSWITFTMRLAADAKPVKYYSIQATNYEAGGRYKRDASAFMLEGSVDGREWEILDDRVLTEPYQTKSQATGWYHWAVAEEKDKVGFELAKTAPSPRSVNLGSISVAAGARLKVDTPLVVSNLIVDVADAGTIENVILAPFGGLDIVGADKSTRGLPIRFENVDGLANVKNWTLTINGAPASGRSIVVTGDSGLALLPDGFILSFR